MGEPARGAGERSEGDGPVVGAAPDAPVTPAAASAATEAAPAVPDPLRIPPRATGNRPEERSLLRRFWSYIRDIALGIWNKGADDNIFFLAGAIAFNVLVAFIPLLLAVIGIAGTVFKGQRAQNTVIRYLQETIPGVIGEELPYEQILSELARNSAGLLSIGTLFFLWVATRLVGTLRTVLRDIFDIAEGRGIVAGKIFDIKMVFMAGTLFALNIGFSIGLPAAARIVTNYTGLNPDEIPFLNQATNWWPHLLALATIWVMFLLVYRYLPPRRIRWSTAVLAATFTSVIAEALKYGFTAYVENIADFTAFWGNVATFVILVLWIYYTSVVFILGGEFAQVVTMRRIRRRQKERLW